MKLKALLFLSLAVAAVGLAVAAGAFGCSPAESHAHAQGKTHVADTSPQAPDQHQCHHDGSAPQLSAIIPARFMPAVATPLLSKLQPIAQAYALSNTQLNVGQVERPPAHWFRQGTRNSFASIFARNGRLLI